MPNGEIAARGKVVRIDNGSVIFNPLNTNYEMKLACAVPYCGTVGTVTELFIRGAARKLWTVTSGGNFVAPIFGPPRIVQGRIRSIDPVGMVVHAGVSVYVKLPAEESTYDLGSGPLAVGQLVNVALQLGVSCEPAVPEAAANA